MVDFLDGSKGVVSFTKLGPNAMTWGGSVGTRKWATWRFGDSDDSERVDVLDPKVSPLKLTVPFNLNLRIYVMGILFADSYPKRWIHKEVPNCKVNIARFLRQDLFVFSRMFPCQKGFRHATGIGNYRWLMIIMVICLVHSFLLFSICLFSIYCICFIFYSQTFLCLCVDGLPRTEDCEFEESLLGATWELFV